MISEFSFRVEEKIERKQICWGIPDKYTNGLFHVYTIIATHVFVSTPMSIMITRSNAKFQNSEQDLPLKKTVTHHHMTLSHPQFD